LRVTALIRLGIVERHAGRLLDARAFFDRAAVDVDSCATITSGRFHAEYATTLKEIEIAERRRRYLDLALDHYDRARECFERIGNRILLATVVNNRGYLHLTLKNFGESRNELNHARMLFDEVADTVGRAQVDETLAQLYLASEDYAAAESSIELAVETLEGIGEDALLAEALTTQGLILCRRGRRHEAKPIIERGRRV